MKRLWMSGAAAMMAMSIGSLGAQTPQTPPPLMNDIRRS
jgi:hypothetical protein